MDPKVILDKKEFLVVVKPSGWITNEADTTKGQSVLQTWIKENLDFPIAGSKEFRSGIVHRLDKETSGVLIIAKTKHAFEDLQGQFKNRTVQKNYIALVHGKLFPEKGSVDAPVGRLPWNRERFGVLPGGREAQTDYSVEEYYKKGADVFSLVNVFPKTGRTHQIRIHMKHLGHPLVADTFYAGRKTARNDRRWCLRMFLHAKGISFSDPASGETVKVESLLPDDLASVIDSLEIASERG